MDVFSYLNKKVSPSESKRLPKLLSEYVGGLPHRTMKPYLLQLVFNWLRNLERAHYKASQYDTLNYNERRMERALLFLQMVRENSHLDMPLLMTMFRWQFANVEVLLLCRHWRIAIAEERHTVLGKLRHPDVEFLKVLLSVKKQLDREGKPQTYDNVLEGWKTFRTRKSGRPGEKAMANFRDKYERFECLLAKRRELEQSWVSLVPDSHDTDSD